MRTYLLTCCIIMSSITLSAQDFTSLFLEECKTDTLFTKVTISPKMMGEILKIETDKDEDMLEVIASLKSMQILSADNKAGEYYQKALQVLVDNPRRFKTYLSYKDESEDYRIVVRKKGELIVELIMLMVEEDHFVIINFTGKIKPEFISTLTGPMTRKQS